MNGRILAAVLIALTALVLLAPHATSRSVAVTPSSDLGAAETDQPRTGAPSNGLLATPSPGGDSRVVTGGTPTPHPTGEIGEPAFAWAPGHEPTPKPPKPALRGSTLSGQATWWFSFGHGLYAAIRPDLGTKGDLAIVCGGKPWHCLSLPVITTCACLGPGSDRLIDLSLDAFRSFANPSAGVVRVLVQVIKR